MWQATKSRDIETQVDHSLERTSRCLGPIGGTEFSLQKNRSPGAGGRCAYLLTVFSVSWLGEDGRENTRDAYPALCGRLSLSLREKTWESMEMWEQLLFSHVVTLGEIWGWVCGLPVWYPYLTSAEEKDLHHCSFLCPSHTFQAHFCPSWSHSSPTYLRDTSQKVPGGGFMD